jgi:hypothetical protein
LNHEVKTVKELIKIKGILVAIVLFATMAIATQKAGACASCAEIRDASGKINATKDASLQEKEAKNAYDSLEKFVSEFSKTPPSPQDLHLALKLVYIMATIDPSKFSVEQIYQLSKTHKIIFKDTLKQMPETAQKLIGDELKSYERMLKKGNG